MYQQSDKTPAIKEIQEYLFFLSDKKYESIKRIPIDGVFDKETEDAVIAFQLATSLEPTGIVDYETFTTLYTEYVRVYEEYNEKGYIFGDGSFPLQENDQNEDVRALHVMINELRKNYTKIGEVGTGSYFSSRTGDAIEAISKIFLLPKTRKLNKGLYKRMKEEIESIKQFEEKHP